MRQSRSQESPSPEERMAVVAASWRGTLEQIPTLIGRLSYLSSLRTGEAGRYEHYGIAQRLGQDGAHALLSQSHTDIFQSWLALDLEQQKNEIARHLFEKGDPFWGNGREGPNALASWI